MNKDQYKNEKVGEIIQTYCAEHKINESDFAALLGIHPASLPRIKSGETCDYKMLSKIALLGKTEIAELLRSIPDSLKQEIILSGNEKGLPVYV